MYPDKEQSVAIYFPKRPFFNIYIICVNRRKLIGDLSDLETNRTTVCFGTVSLHIHLGFNQESRTHLPQ